MSLIKQQTLKKAISMLNAIGASYAIIDEDGTKHGELNVLRSLAPRKYPRGTLSNYVKPYLENMKVGDVVPIPIGEFSMNDIRSAAVSWSCYHWGNGTLTTAIDKEGGKVEALRISEGENT